MKQLNWVFLILFPALSLEAQTSLDFGIGAGVTSYLGDINPNRLLYSPMPAGIAFFRYNFNPRQALRANIMAGGLRGSDLDFNNEFQQNRAVSFSGIIGEAALQYEFNFLPYRPGKKLYDYTPYFAAGAGVAVDAAGGNGILPVIPFSFGFKINLLRNMGLEAEYGFRKTFYDNFDALNEELIPQTDHGVIHNNDWYTFTGVSLTWTVGAKKAPCPVYDDVNTQRKR